MTDRLLQAITDIGAEAARAADDAQEARRNLAARIEEHRSARARLERLVLAARDEGVTYAQIGQALGITPQGAMNLVKRARAHGGVVRPAGADGAF